jgi:hypothetical protein
MNDDFYVGYQPRAPRGLGLFVRGAAVGVGLLAALIGLVLLYGQGPFDRGTFAYLDYRSYSGVLRLGPYPRIDGYWLVGPGKHGADAADLGGEGAQLRMKGALIENGADRMLEVLPGSIERGPAGAVTADVELGRAILTGEIVDTKCYFGVMKPGRGKVHRACAARCLSGGIPAGLLVRDAEGTARVVMLAGRDGRAVSREAARLAGDRVTVAGALVRSGDSLILKSEPREYVRE